MNVGGWYYLYTRKTIVRIPLVEVACNSDYNRSPGWSRREHAGHETPKITEI